MGLFATALDDFQVPINIVAASAAAVAASLLLLLPKMLLQLFLQAQGLQER